MSQPRTAPDEFETTDLAIAAFLVAKDFPLLRVNRGAERVVFVFPAGAADVAVRFYRPGQNLVEARKFHVSLRELRGLAHGRTWGPR